MPVPNGYREDGCICPAHSPAPAQRAARGKLRALIISPTRELAEQTHTAIGALGRQTGVRSLTIYGGVGAQPQIKGLRAGSRLLLPARVACWI